MMACLSISKVLLCSCIEYFSVRLSFRTFLNNPQIFFISMFFSLIAQVKVNFKDPSACLSKTLFLCLSPKLDTTVTFNVQIKMFSHSHSLGNIPSQHDTCDTKEDHSQQ